LSSSRLAQCFIHHYIKNQQAQAYWLDKQELLEGKFGMRIFGEIFSGVLLVDFGVMKPSSSRHEDFVCNILVKASNNIIIIIIITIITIIVIVLGDSCIFNC
jgi:hypothetical protein